MADNNASELAEITARETAEFEQMADILARKRDAIARLDTPAVQEILGEEISKMNTIRRMERERASILQSLSISGEELGDPASLERKLGKQDAENFVLLHSRFRGIFDRVLQLNGTCRFLLINSLAFIRQNIRILTDDGNRKLVDKKA